MKVIVLSGGTSDEREVSLRSGKNVAKALTHAGHSVITADPKELSESELRTICRSGDVVFIALHGKGGEDGSVQALLDAWHVPYVGSGAESSAMCISKKTMRTLAVEAGMRVPKGDVVTYEEFAAHPLTKQPFVVKPDIGGSSIDTFIVREPESFKHDSLKEVFAAYGVMVLEELIAGVEITVGVLGDEALPVIEIIPPAHEEFDYENKYNGHTQELCPPKNVSAHDQNEAQRLAKQAHDIFGCRHMSRSDFMLSPEGELYLLDVNTIPGLTEQSLLPKAAKQRGLDMSELVDTLVKFAVAS